MKKGKKIVIIALILFCSMFFLDNILADTYNNYSPNEIVSCGDGYLTNIPAMAPKVISIAFIILQIAVPVVLVIFGSLDLFKGIIAQDEKEIKQGQQLFIKRLISAALVFFVFVIVKVVISFVADDSGIMGCAACFIENECDVVTSGNTDTNSNSNNQNTNQQIQLN